MESFTVHKPCSMCLGKKSYLGLGGMRQICGHCGGSGMEVVVKIQTVEECQAYEIKEEKVINPVPDLPTPPTKLAYKMGRPKKDNNK